MHMSVGDAPHPPVFGENIGEERRETKTNKQGGKTRRPAAYREPITANDKEQKMRKSDWIPKEDEAFKPLFKWDFSRFMPNTPFVIPEWPDIPEDQDDEDPQTPDTE
jgi:hypothetical protein